MKRVQDNEQIEVNSLEYLALKYSESDINNNEIRKNNVTELFWQELKNMLNNKECIVVQILGKTTSGKSTAMIKIVAEINKWLKKPMGLDKIHADQFEFGRATMKEENNICYGVDEISLMEQSGYNSTIEEKYLEHFSDVMAQKFLHRIACSPRKILDSNTEIILQTIGKNIQEKTTKCLLYYKRNTPTTEIMQLVGSIDIYVGDIMKEDYYQRYRIRKFKKFELMHKEGIFQMREMQFARIQMKCYDKLKELCKGMNPNKDMIEAKAKIELREEKMPITMFALEYLKSAIGSLTKQEYAYQLMKKREKKADNKEDQELAKKSAKEIGTALEYDLKKTARLIAINDEYERI